MNCFVSKLRYNVSSLITVIQLVSTDTIITIGLISLNERFSHMISIYTNKVWLTDTEDLQWASLEVLYWTPSTLGWFTRGAGLLLGSDRVAVWVFGCWLWSTHHSPFWHPVQHPRLYAFDYNETFSQEWAIPAHIIYIINI